MTTAIALAIDRKAGFACRSGLTDCLSWLASRHVAGLAQRAKQGRRSVRADRAAAITSGGIRGANAARMNRIRERPRTRAFTRFG
jgi:hypothetical protein